MAKIFDKWEIAPSVEFESGYDESSNPSKIIMPSANVMASAIYKDDTPPNPHNYVYEVIGGKEYPTVKIGNQVGMAENLDYNASGSVYSNNTPREKWGRLYAWPLAISVASAISGWHLPSWDEWSVLVNSAGGTSTAGAHLKATSGWDSYSGKSGNGLDTYGFSALPCGNFNEGTSSFTGVGRYGYFWTTCTPNVNGYVTRRHMSYSDSGMKNEDAGSWTMKTRKFSIRLVKG
jgi:uncharacterized protein (TIGR02145 family)